MRDPFAVPAHAKEIFAALEPYLHPTPLLVVISGPSGVGKDSVIKRMQALGYPFHFIVTATDRPPRPGEVDGVDYHFVSTAEFERMIAKDELLEYARVYGQYKGVPKAEAREALASGRDVIMRLDVQGAATIRRLVPQALSIFLVPPSLEVLVARLRRRAGDSAEQVQRRLQTALEELKRLDEFEYIVVNREGQLDETVRQVAAIITAAKCQTRPRRITL